MPCRRPLPLAFAHALENAVQVFSASAARTAFYSPRLVWAERLVECRRRLRSARRRKRCATEFEDEPSAVSIAALAQKASTFDWASLRFAAAFNRAAARWNNAASACSRLLRDCRLRTMRRLHTERVLVRPPYRVRLIHADCCHLLAAGARRRYRCILRR